MADIRTTVYTILSSAAGITALVGTSPSRIWRNQLPQNTAGDALVYFVLDRKPDQTQPDGPNGLVQVWLMIDAHADSNTNAALLAAAVETVLDGYTGTVGGVFIQGIFLDRERDIYDDSIKKYRVSQVYKLFYS